MIWKQVDYSLQLGQNKIFSEMQDAPLYMALSSPNAQQIDSVSCRSHFKIYCYLAAAANTNYHPENVKEASRVSIFTGVGLLLQVRICFRYHFERDTLCCSQIY